ncbi:hypothetical protein [Nannocystis pusilla]
MTASFDSIREQVAAGDASGGWVALTQVFGYPNGGRSTASRSRRRWRWRW